MSGALWSITRRARLRRAPLKGVNKPPEEAFEKTAAKELFRFWIFLIKFFEELNTDLERGR